MDVRSQRKKFITNLPEFDRDHVVRGSCVWDIFHAFLFRLAAAASQIDQNFCPMGIFPDLSSFIFI